MPDRSARGLRPAGARAAPAAPARRPDCAPGTRRPVRRSSPARVRSAARLRASSGVQTLVAMSACERRPTQSSPSTFSAAPYIGDESNRFAPCSNAMSTTVRDRRRAQRRTFSRCPRRSPALRGRRRPEADAPSYTCPGCAWYSPSSSFKLVASSGRLSPSRKRMTRGNRKREAGAVVRRAA